MTVDVRRLAATTSLAVRLPAISGPMALLGLVLLSLLPRLYRLNAQGLWLDEADTGLLARGPLQQIWSERLAGDHVPAYFTLAWLVTHIFGESERVLRMPSVLAGVAAVIGTWAIGRELNRPLAGLIGALLVAFSPLSIFWTQQAKPEALELALGVWSSFLLIAAARRNHRRLWLAYWIVSLIGLYTFLFHALVLFAQNVVVLGWWLRRHKARGITLWLVSQMLLGFALLAWIVPRLGWMVSDVGSRTGVERMGIWQFVVINATAFLGGEPSSGALPDRGDLAAIVIVSAILLAGLSPMLMHRRPRFGTVVVLGWAILPILAAYASTFVLPRFTTRYLMVVVPPLCLLIGMVVEELVARDKVARFFGIASLVLLMGVWAVKNVDVYQHPRYEMGFRDVTAYFLANREDRGAVLGLSGYEKYPYEYYLKDPAYFVDASADDPAGTRQQLQRLRQSGYKGVWLTYYGLHPNRFEPIVLQAADSTDLIGIGVYIKMRYFRFR